MMAEIPESEASSGPYHQPTPANRPTGAAIVTAVAGFWAMFNGFFVFLIAIYAPGSSLAMFIMAMGVANMLLGLVGFYAGYSVYNLESRGKGLGIVVDIILIVANLILLAIGFLGLALCIISIIALVMYKPS